MEGRTEKKYKALKKLIGEILLNLPVEHPEDLSAIQRITEKLYRSETLKDFEKVKIDLSSFFRDKRLIHLDGSEKKERRSVPQGVPEPLKKVLKTSIILISDVLGDEKDRLLRAAEAARSLSDLERLEKEIKELVIKRDLAEKEPVRESLAKLGVSEKVLQEMREALTMLSSYLLDLIKNFIEEADNLGERIEGVKEKLSEVNDPEEVYVIKNEIEDILFRYYDFRELSGREIVELKDIVLHLGSTLESFLDAAGGFSVRIKDYLEELSKAKSLDEITKLKEAIIKETEKIRDISITLTERMKELQEQLTYFQEKVRKLERKLEETRQKMLTDPLMGINNRRALKNRLREMISLFSRNKKPFAFLMMDIDHFKKINDTYGHSVGDKVLKAVASVIKKSLREYDELFRYGGEEIAAILPETGIDEAKRVAERIRRAVSSVSFVTKTTRFSVTISIGVTQAKDGDTEDSLIERADEALYRAKNSGRNRVEVEL